MRPSTVAGMSSSTTPQPLSMAAVTAAILGIAGLVIAAVAIPGFKPVGLVLAIAAVVAGAAAAVNARRTGRAGAWLGWTGAVLGAATLAYLLVWQLA